VLRTGGEFEIDCLIVVGSNDKKWERCFKMWRYVLGDGAM